MSPSPYPKIEVITSPSDLPAAFNVNAQAFGVQTNDGIWSQIFPRWNTTEGAQQAVSRLEQRLIPGRKTIDGDPTTVFLKAIVPDKDDPSKEAIAGFAIWMQGSMNPDYGEVPHENVISDEELDLLYPGDEREQRYLRQLMSSLVKRRIETIREKASTRPPAIFILDSCAVDPAYQRRGIASMLVRWGLEEAKRRGGLECTTEGSRMGRHVYLKEGFFAEGQGEDMPYVVDEEFARRDRPPNLFLRTGDGGKR